MKYITAVQDIDDFLILGSTRDDSPGEVLDKVARRLKVDHISLLISFHIFLFYFLTLINHLSIFIYNEKMLISNLSVLKKVKYKL